MLRPGATAPEFGLDSMSGGKCTLAEILARGPVLLAFFKISCPVCQLTLPYLDRIANGLQVIGISQDDENATARFQLKYGLSIPVLLDRERDGYPASNAFGITHVPSLFLVETDGSISLAFDGFVKREVEALGNRAGVRVFQHDETPPEWKAG